MRLLPIVLLAAACASEPQRAEPQRAETLNAQRTEPVMRNAWVRPIVWTACPSPIIPTPYCEEFMGSVGDDRYVPVICHTQGMASADGVKLFHAWLIVSTRRKRTVIPPCVIEVEPEFVVPLPHDRTVALPNVLRVAGQESVGLLVPVGITVLIQLVVEARPGHPAVSNVYEISSAEYRPR